MKAFMVASRFEHEGKHYGLRVPFGEGVLDLTEAEFDALPELNLSPRELRICGSMLIDLAKARAAARENLGLEVEP